jgi:biotin carboxyl carrier protein
MGVAGQAVKAGDHLVTLEAMKMNTFVFAPKDGKITAMLTEVGAAVDEGQVLVKID